MECIEEQQDTCSTQFNELEDISEKSNNNFKDLFKTVDKTRIDFNDLFKKISEIKDEGLNNTIEIDDKLFYDYLCCPKISSFLLKMSLVIGKIFSLILFILICIIFFHLAIFPIFYQWMSLFSKTPLHIVFTIISNFSYIVFCICLVLLVTSSTGNLLKSFKDVLHEFKIIDSIYSIEMVRKPWDRNSSSEHKETYKVNNIIKFIVTEYPDNYMDIFYQYKGDYRSIKKFVIFTIIFIVLWSIYSFSFAFYIIAMIFL